MVAAVADLAWMQRVRGQGPLGQQDARPSRFTIYVGPYVGLHAEVQAQSCICRRIALLCSTSVSVNPSEAIISGTRAASNACTASNRE